MTDHLSVANDGQAITATNYWQSEIEAAGKFFLSVNAGAIRLLVPRSRVAMVEEVRGAEYAILSRGPWPAGGTDEAIEMLWEDHSDTPYSLHLTTASCDLLPAAPEPGRQWTLSVWTLQDRAPQKATEHVCHWRRVAQLPWLKPL